MEIDFSPAGSMTANKRPDYGLSKYLNFLLVYRNGTWII